MSLTCRPFSRALRLGAVISVATIALVIPAGATTQRALSPAAPLASGDCEPPGAAACRVVGGVPFFAADDEQEAAITPFRHATGTPSASPVPDTDSASEAVAVKIEGFAYKPQTVEIPVGGSVTWTNDDTAPHTATGVDKTLLDSGWLSFGQSFTQTFDRPGSLAYYCAYHPGMKGTIVVRAQ